MSDAVQIVLVIAVAILVVLLIFRKQLSNFQFKGGKNGVEMQLKTHKEAKSTTSLQSDGRSGGVSVSRNKLWGRKNKIDIRSGSRNISADDNQMLGEEQDITVKPESKRK
jgi:hypothetical protein